MAARRLLISAILVTLVLMTAATSGLAATEVELWTFIDPSGDSVRSQALAHIIDTFEEANPDITIRSEIMQWSQISPTLLRAVRARRVPDVAMVFSPYLPLQIEARSLEPLTPYIADWPEEKLNDYVLPPRGNDGELYAFFYELRASSVFYRSDIFEDLGLEVPGSLEEMTETALKLKDEGFVGFTFGVNPKSPAGFSEWFIPVVVGMDAPILNTDGTAAFNNDKFLEATQWVYDAVHKHEITPLDVVLLGSDEVELLFDAGRTAMLAKMTHRLTTIRERSGFGDAVQTMPVLTLGGVAPPMVEGWTLAIPRGAENADAAWKFIDHWVSPEMQLHQSTTAGYIPARASVLEDPWFDTEEAKDIRWAVEYAADRPFEFQFPADTERFYDVINRMFEQILTDQMSPEDGLAWGEREWNSGLN